jgi:hypothetical protein
MHALSVSPMRERQLELHRRDGKTYPSLTTVWPMPYEPRHPFAHGRQETKL